MAAITPLKPLALKRWLLKCHAASECHGTSYTIQPAYSLLELIEARLRLGRIFSLAASFDPVRTVCAGVEVVRAIVAGVHAGIAAVVDVATASPIVRATCQQQRCAQS